MTNRIVKGQLVRLKAEYAVYDDYKQFGIVLNVKYGPRHNGSRDNATVLLLPSNKQVELPSMYWDVAVGLEEK